MHFKQKSKDPTGDQARQPLAHITNNKGKTPSIECLPRLIPRS